MHIFIHLSFPWSHPWAFAVTSAIVALCPQDILSDHRCFLLFLLFSISSKGVNPLLPDSWGSEPAVYPTMSRGLCFSEQGFAQCLCVRWSCCTSLQGCRLAAPCCLQERGFGGRSLQSQALLLRRCCLRTSPEYIKHNFLLLHRKLVNISLGHGGRLQSPRFKGGQLSAALGLAFGFPSSCYNSFCGFENR